MNYYEILGVDAYADVGEIKSAFRKLARKYHPDVNKDHDAKTRFELIYIAYEILTDPMKRRFYDELQEGKKADISFTDYETSARTQAGSFSAMDYEDFDETVLSKIQFHANQSVGLFFCFGLLFMGMLLALLAYYFLHQPFDGAKTICFLAFVAASLFLFYGSRGLLKVFETWR
ncbi:MAG: DnaJ domain-containing protein [Bacteroidetes bacterium]|nr:DnaJ domain-containing protein [Bacteroidota bacterium]